MARATPRACTPPTAPSAGTTRVGALLSTGRDLDVAVNGKGWIAVQDADGKEAYTRAGDLQVDPTGQLVTGDRQAGDR